MARRTAAMIMAFADEQGRLPIHVTPNATANAVGLPAPGATPVLLIDTAAAPDNGRANEVAIALLA